MKKKIGILVVLVALLSACGPAPTPAPTPTLTPTPIVATTNTPTATAQPTLTPFQPVPHLNLFFAEQSILRTFNLSTGFHGVYIHELTSPDYITFNPNLQLHGASTIKLPIAVVALKTAQEEGLDIYSFIPAGQDSSLSTLLMKMLVFHEDSATNTLITFVNGTGRHFDTILVSLGFDGFNINERLTTAASLGKLYETIAVNSLNLNENDYLLNLLAQSSGKDDHEFPWTINGKLPGQYQNLVGAIYDADIPVARLGTVRFVAADSGIWITPDGHQFVIVLIGNYDSNKGFYSENSFIQTTANILAEMETK